MKERFEISMMCICPFIRFNSLNITPDLKYPNRLCVIDKKENIVIDIKTNLKYEYLETFSRFYVQTMIDKIENNRRVAIPASLDFTNYKEDYKKGLIIIEKLKFGEKFKDGNEVFNNEQYLDYINQESAKKENIKVKKIGKKIK